MRLSELKKTKFKSKKRVGRGYGSGKGGHTSSRGQKGQKSRSKVRLLFEGTKVRKSFILRMPMLRGKKKLTSLEKPYLTVSTGDLNVFPAESRVDTASLAKKGLVREKLNRYRGVKLVSRGKIRQKLTVALPVTQSARLMIEQAGGQVVSPKTAQQKLKKES